MMFRFAAVLALLTSSATANVNLTPNGDVNANSELGARLLAKATVVEHAEHTRRLDDERDVTFVANYSLRYLGCSSLVQVAEEQNENGGMLYTQHLVRFALCPTENCAACSGGGEYVMAMEEFVDAYTEAKLTEKEYACEMIRENCDCENANDDDVCEAQCYVTAGMDECIEYEGEEEFEIQRYLECIEMEGGNDNNGGNYYQDGVYYGNFFIGPYCSPSDGKSIHLGVFYDEGCTAKGDNSLYAKQNYGVELPFIHEPIVTSECMSCKQVNDDDNNNNNNNGQNSAYYQEELEVTEFCAESYEMASRCEEKMSEQYTDTSGCDYINNILPRLEAASRSIGVGGSQGKAAKAFAVIFAFTTALFAAYAYFLYRKIKRGSVDLSSQQ